jgi:hypothetical protein
MPSRQIAAMFADPYPSYPYYDALPPEARGPASVCYSVFAVDAAGLYIAMDTLVAEPPNIPERYTIYTLIYVPVVAADTSNTLRAKLIAAARSAYPGTYPITFLGDSRGLL